MPKTASTPRANSGYVGSLKGQFQVDSNGQATYSIPLQLPPGTAGMMPSLAVVYNSGGANDLLGVGWRLDGFSTISRSAPTMAQDGFHGAVSYGPNDRLNLDGQRLVPVQGSYNDTDAVYHTELESWRKVIPVYGNTPNRVGPDSFIVYAKDGKQWEYGGTADSQVQASPDNPSIRVWALSRITDTHGNYITFTYSPDTNNGAYYPLTIAYTGNGSASPQRTVQFSYEQRPTASDMVPSFVGGSPVCFTQRLTKIQTAVHGSNALTYSFAYQSGVGTGRSQLISVTQSDANGIALPPTSFTWQDSPASIFSPAKALPQPPNTPYGSILLPMDVIGNGVADFVSASNQNGNLDLTLFVSNGSGFGNPITIPVSDLKFGGQLLPMDVNSDGRIDLVYAMNENGNLGLTVFFAGIDNQGNPTLIQQQTNSAGPSNIKYGGTLLSMDVDGDGMVDLVYASNNNGQLDLQVWFSNGSTFAPSSEDKTAPTAKFGGQFFPMDVNGDGMVDLVYATSETVGTSHQLGLTLFLANGRSGLTQQSECPLPTSAALPFGGTLLPLDVNGDGNFDLVYAVRGSKNNNLQLYTLLSTGAFTSSNGSAAVSFALQNNGQPQDTGLSFAGSALPLLMAAAVVGSGLTDILVASPISGTGQAQLGLNVLLSTGSGYALQSGVTQPGMNWGGQLLPMDIAGSGLTGILYATSQSGLQLANVLAAGPYPDLALTFTNGYGGQEQVSYLPITNPSIYSESPAVTDAINVPSQNGNTVSGATYTYGQGGLPPAGTPGKTAATRVVDIPKYVVAQHTRTDGRGGSYAYSYTYAGAQMDLTGRGWLGFASICMTDTSVGASSTLHFNQVFPLTFQLAQRTTQRVSDGAAMDALEFAYNTAMPYTGVSLPLLETLTTKNYTFGTLDSTQTKTFSFDSFGNATLTTTDGGATLYIFEDFSNDPTNWILGFKTSRKLTSDSAGQQVLSFEQMAHDPKTQDLISFGTWDDGAQQWLTTTFSYDPYGNRTSETDASGAVTQTGFDTIANTFVASRTSPANRNGLTLATTFVNDPGSGIWISQTDPNGSVREQSVDGLGRIVTVSGPAPSGTLVPIAQYSWGSDQQGIYQETQLLLAWEDANPWTWKKDYLDGFGRVYLTETLADDGGQTVQVTRAFDSRNNVVQESMPFYTGASPVYIQRTYDAYGRLIQLITPADGGGTSTIQTDYVSSTHVVQTEAYGTSQARQTTLDYATFNSKPELIRRTDALNAATVFSYDAMGRRTSVLDPLGVSTTITYDTLGRQVAVSVGSGSTVYWSETFAFDDDKRTVTSMDANKTATVQTYDALKRQIGKQVGADAATTWTYDDSAQSNGLGRLCAVAQPGAFAYTFAYDAYGNQTGISLAVDGDSYAFAKTYAPTGQVLTVTFPDNTEQTNAYTPAGHLQSVSYTGEVYASYQNFTAFGSAQAVAYPQVGSAMDTFAYNPAGQLSSQQVQGPTGQVLMDTSFHWNVLADLASIDDGLDVSRNQAFQYDAVGRITQATGNFAEQNFAYDGGGNLQQKNGVTFTYQGYQPQSGTENGETVFSADYDANGSMLSASRNGVNTSYTYDGEGQLIASGGASFSYDYTGRRLKKTTSSGLTTWYIAPYFEVTLLPSGVRQQTVSLVGAHGVFAVVTTDTSTENTLQETYPGVPTPGTFYLHKNQINSTSIQTDAQGDVVTTVEYLPYGEIASLTGADSLRRKFTGQELDAETGLYYFGARYYDPWLARFTTADDRLGAHWTQPDAFNRYAYVLNSPVRNIDPTGHGISGWWKQFLQQAAQYAVDTVLIVAGAVVLAGGTAIGAGPAATLIGSTLLGAGISGLAYNITQDIKGKPIGWGDWGIQLGIGAAAGLLAGAMGVGAGFVAKGLQIGAGAATVLFNTGSGAAIGAATGVASQVLNNAANHVWLGTALGSAALFGAGFGAVASGLTEAISRAPVFERSPTVQEANGLLAKTPSNYQTFPLNSDILENEFAKVYNDTPFNRFIVSWPGTAVNVLNNAIWDLNWHPAW